MQRRRLLVTGGACLGAIVAATATVQSQALAQANVKPDTAPEHLMREHAVLERVLLIYDDAAQRLTNQTYSMQVLAGAARLVREVIEDHHMQLEEDYIFARFSKRNREMNLIQTLISQHRAAREVTDTILRFANDNALRDNTQRGLLIAALQNYVRVSRPHDAHEGSSLFPQFQGIVSAQEYAAVAEQFERADRQKLGADGYARILSELAQLEQRVELADLSQFTPRPPGTTGSR